jgi:hypothetical protein
VTDPVLVGAGDMGTCASTNDEATARLLDSLSGTVFTTGDNDYVDATPPPAYGVCFDSTWGRHKWRVRPAAGDDDSLAGYFSYFGAAAHGPTGYYSYDLGTWHVCRAEQRGAGGTRAPCAGCAPISSASRVVHGRDLTPPSLQLREHGQLVGPGTVFSGAGRRRSGAGDRRQRP